jgi:tetratricopeptide (TPR) repeat protein
MSTVRDRQQAKAHLDRGIERRMVNDLDGAIAEYNIAIQFDPLYAEAYNNRGNIYSLREDHSRAIADYSEAIRLDPKYAVAYYNRGLEKQLEGDIQGAIADYKMALSLVSPPSLTVDGDKFLANIHCNLGIIYETLGEHENALAHFDKAVTYDSRHISAYYNRGFAHERNGNFVLAARDYWHVLELDPDHRQSRYMQELIKKITFLQSELKTRLSRYTTDIDKAVSDIWPLLSNAFEGVQFDTTTTGPYTLLDRRTVESLLEEMDRLNLPSASASTEGKQTGNGD